MWTFKQIAESFKQWRSGRSTTDTYSAVPAATKQEFSDQPNLRTHHTNIAPLRRSLWQLLTACFKRSSNTFEDKNTQPTKTTKTDLPPPGQKQKDNSSSSIKQVQAALNIAPTENSKNTGSKQPKPPSGDLSPGDALTAGDFLAMLDSDIDTYTPWKRIVDNNTLTKNRPIVASIQSFSTADQAIKALVSEGILDEGLAAEKKLTLIRSESPYKESIILNKLIKQYQDTDIIKKTVPTPTEKVNDPSSSTPQP
jgi:hypothetical protein